MSKNIVLCLHGTWNGPDAKATDGGSTPIKKVCENLKGAGPLGPMDNEREIAADAAGMFPSQLAKYIHGVESANNQLAKTVEGAVDVGLVARIVRGCTHLSRQHEPGDSIFIIGFSRGTHTARALAGFAVGQGLLDWKAMQLDAFPLSPIQT